MPPRRRTRARPRRRTNEPMGYRNALLFRWSRRDRLTVVVVAVTAAFLIGTVLLLFTAVTYSETFAEPLANSGTVTYHDAENGPPETGGDVTVLPTATATTSGTDVRLVGIPPDTPGCSSRGRPSGRRDDYRRFPTALTAGDRSLSSGPERLAGQTVPSRLPLSHRSGGRRSSPISGTRRTPRPPSRSASPATSSSTQSERDRAGKPPKRRGTAGQRAPVRPRRLRAGTLGAGHRGGRRWLVGPHRRLQRHADERP